MKQDATVHRQSNICKWTLQMMLFTFWLRRTRTFNKTIWYISMPQLETNIQQFVQNCVQHSSDKHTSLNANGSTLTVMRKSVQRRRTGELGWYPETWCSSRWIEACLLTRIKLVNKRRRSTRLTRAWTSGYSELKLESNSVKIDRDVTGFVRFDWIQIKIITNELTNLYSARETKGLFLEVDLFSFADSHRMRTIIPLLVDWKFRVF